MESKQYVEDIDFQKYWLILKRRWLPATMVFLLSIGVAVGVAYTRQPIYEAGGKLLLQKKNKTSALVTKAGEKIGELDSLNAFINTPLDTEAQVITSLPLIQKTIERLNLKTENGSPIKPENLLGRLTVKGLKGTDVMTVSVKSQKPKEAAAIVNKLMEVYLENNIQTNRSEAVAARKFIERQLPKTESTVRQAEAALRRFKEENNIVAIEEEAKSAVQAMAELDSKLSQTKSNLEDATARSIAIQNQLNLNENEAVALNSLSQSRAVQQILVDIEQIEAQLTVQRTRYQEEHPIIQNLKRREDAQKSLLQERISKVLGTGEILPTENLQIGDLKESMTKDLVKAEVERLGFVRQAAYLERAKLAYQQRANLLPRLQEGLRDFERQLGAAQSTYEILLRNYQDVRIAENQNVGNADILARALVPEDPVSPKKKLILGGGIIAGSLLYIIVAFVLDLMDPSIKTAKEVRQLFRYTWLGMIPNLRKKGLLSRRKSDGDIPQLPVRDAPHAIVSEAYRMLEANLKFLSPDKMLKVIVVTSSVSREGKSTVSANLAAAMAQLGRKVLLIDADMRHPIQHHIWDLANAMGLSEVIVNHAEFKDAVREVTDNLDVLPSGAIPPNSLALLNSKRMAFLVDDFAKTYDFVIFDTPPLVLTADAITLGKMTDGILLVSRPGVIDRVSASASNEFLVRSGQQVLGLVVNGVRIENEPDSYFHHAKIYYKGEEISGKLKQDNRIKNLSKF
ncbi:MAG TPA: lipopolysaccharide biosynthesis protein [Cyanobacteria bacterium UBA11159]|nr:lipopolysaccharide biosynthesis protein [Cyanobacteria bacterium UBA11367]HBE60933.1 lipopolysaccharide biosynthesis protein [Cyanobacteria bacterium UBA11366]HBK62435.1 lipopolysaccharide biosynthesis protein [Cyanobacteria bacterium UBA11166]HBR76395.1 lipopolysaccharide biosynthesis protein [Cyanobacteria bacterium UBA11159]HBS72050.1 lipopolysaccharide biosynthesis protein [Cyanobacteria bacterium UBA11153]HCA95463.1 lipopolysaccharide biosynthesis protein [Cyanobacteria bacterium UBA92